jgi:hypothetical protein
MPRKFLPTSLVGSYPQPDWLIDRKKLASRFPPRVRAKDTYISRNHHTAEQSDPRAPYLLFEGELSARKNTNCGPRILQGGEASRTCIEVAGDQSVADFGWPMLSSMQAVVAHLGQLLSSFAPLRERLKVHRVVKKWHFTKELVGASWLLIGTRALSATQPPHQLTPTKTRAPKLSSGGEEQISGTGS